jgi:hypothetical protein
MRRSSLKNKRLGRRDFLRRGALTGLGVGLLPLGSAASAVKKSAAQVQRYVPLSRSGIKMSDVSFGIKEL